MDILRVAQHFSEPPRGEEKYEQRTKSLHVLYVKPYNNIFISPLIAPFSSSLVLSFLNRACIAQELHRSYRCGSGENNTNEITQTPSKVSKLDCDQKIVTLLLTEMLKVKCKDVNKSKFGSFSSAILFLCSVLTEFALFWNGQTRTQQSITGSYLARSLGQISWNGKQWNNNTL